MPAFIIHVHSQIKLFLLFSCNFFHAKVAFLLVAMYLDVDPSLNHGHDRVSITKLDFFVWFYLSGDKLLHRKIFPLSHPLHSLVNLVWKITPFTTQIFEFFIAATFIFESIRDLTLPLRLRFSNDNIPDVGVSGDAQRGLSSEATPRAAAYAGLVIGVATCYICWSLHFAETWRTFPPFLRAFLASYNMMIALIIMTALSYLPGVDQGGELKRVQVGVPWDWQPTANRGWVVNPLDGISVEGIFGALFPALMLYLLFFIDHNISSVLTQSPKYNLTKPPSYHWDFFVLGLTIIPCGILGLPPGSGLIPQAPLHTRALCSKKYVERHGQQHEEFFDCEEQRYSAFFQAALMFVALGCMRVISWIPEGCLFGVFLYLGIGAMHGNEIWERIALMAVPAETRPKIAVVTKVSKWSTVVAYTAIQVFLAAVTFAISQVCAMARPFQFPVNKWSRPQGSRNQRRKNSHRFFPLPSSNFLSLSLSSIPVCFVGLCLSSIDCCFCSCQIVHIRSSLSRKRSQAFRPRGGNRRRLYY